MAEVVVQDNLFLVEDDIFTSGKDMIVNPVNCVGIMGGGLAREFARRFGAEYVDAYKEACSNRRLRVGHPNYYTTDDVIICNFPTKGHYKDPSQYDWIAAGMCVLAEDLREMEVASVALPALGCGLGNLSWDYVKHIIRMGSQLNTDIEWTIYLQ